MNVIDFEASSLKGGSYPIQVGVVKADGSEYSAYIRPLDSWTDWSMKSQDIHNIPRNLLFDVGLPAEQVANELNDFIGEEEVFCDGGIYDIQWANALYYDTNIDRNWKIGSIRDEMLRGLEDMQLAHPWYDIKMHYAKELELKEHDALDDAKLIQHIAKLIKANYV